MIVPIEIMNPGFSSQGKVVSDENAREVWIGIIKKAFDKSNESKGISLYVHLPFCDKHCTYCSFRPHVTINHKVEQVYVEKLLNEWRLYLDLFEEKPQIRQIYFGGGSPTFFTPENLERIITYIKDNADVAPNAELIIEANVINTTVHHLITLHKAGFNAISFGIQDFDPKVQEEIRKRQSPEKVFHVTSLARSIGFEVVNYDVLYGLPHQSRKTIINTIYRIKTVMPERVNLIKYLHDPKDFPGQKVYEKHLPVPEELAKLCEIARDMLLDSGYIEIGMGVFILKKDPLIKAFNNKTLHRNLMGYSRFNTGLTVGIGAGATGDTWNALGENTRNIRDYYQSIERGELPIQNCHKVHGEELLLRNHFYNLQCHLQTTWSDSEKNFVQKAAKRFQAYHFQNLVKITESGLKVKKAGRQYIHAICSALNDVKANNSRIPQSSFTVNQNGGL